MKLDEHPDYYIDDDPSSAAPGRPSPSPAPEQGKSISFETESSSADSSAGSAAADPVQPAAPRKPRRARKFLTWVVCISIAVIAVTIYIRYFNPYVTDARTRGYVTQVERRGIIFKTFEGEMISESALTDTTRVYSRDFNFTIPDDSLALRLQAVQGTGRQVTLTYKKYYATVPWRGSSVNVVTAVEF